MTWTVTMYLLYLAISTALTVWVGRTLYHNGSVFLVEVFAQEGLAKTVNHLLVVGFYLVNFGFVSLFLRVSDGVGNAQQAIEALSLKVGVVLLVLGGMHFMNMFVLNRFRRRGIASRHSTPPVAPDAWTPQRGPLPGNQAPPFVPPYAPPGPGRVQA